jgi:hypothetical protein
MPTEVVSPISRKGSKVGSGQPMSPGARSNPSSRGDQATSQPPEQPAHRVAPHADKPAELRQSPRNKAWFYRWPTTIEPQRPLTRSLSPAGRGLNLVGPLRVVKTL